MRKFAEYVLVFYMLVLSWPGDIYVSALAVTLGLQKDNNNN